MTRRWKNDLSLVRKWRVTMEGKRSKRGRVGEERPTKLTPEVVAKIAEAVAIEGKTLQVSCLETVQRACH